MESFKKALEEKKATLEVVERVVDFLEDMRNDVHRKWDKTGDQEQDWTYKDGKRVPLWQDEEETIPVMRDIHDYVPKDESDYTDADRLKLKIIDDIYKAVMKQI